MVSLPYDNQFPLGCLAEPLSSIEADWNNRVYGDVPEAPMVPRNQWNDRVKDGEELQPDAMIGYIHDQNGYGMCTNSATTSGMEDTELMQGCPREQMTRLSAGDLYRRSGGGQDNGSTLSAALRFAMEGVASTATVPYLDWRNPHGQEAARDRAGNKILEAFWCPTFDHAVSALLNGYRTVCGISWGSGMEPGSDGWCREAGWGGAGGHALKNFRVYRKGNRYGLGTANSWRPTWGRFGGLLILPESHFRSHFGGLFAIRVVTDRGRIAVR